MERSEDDQWSWWQENPGTAAHPPTASTESLPTTDAWTNATSVDQEAPPQQAAAASGDPVRKALIGLVAVLSIGLAGVSYQRWGTGGPSPAAASATTTALVAQPTNQTSSTAPPTTAASTTVLSTSAPATTTSTVAVSTSTTAITAGPPEAPLEVTVISAGRSSAEIRWRSNDCVGSRYQVGDFEPGGGGYPDVNRCWFNHVILAGDPAFSPPLEPSTTYTVRIEAIGQDGSASEPVEVQFTTSQ